MLSPTAAAGAAAGSSARPGISARARSSAGSWRLAQASSDSITKYMYGFIFPAPGAGGGRGGHLGACGWRSSFTVRTKAPKSNGRRASSCIRSQGCSSSSCACGRCSGSLCKQRATKSAKAGEKVSVESVGAGSLMICERRTKALGLAEEKEEYGYWPSAHSTRVMPSDQTSEAKEYGLPPSRSGDM
eukprot:scaffold105885_cov48-Phaeocystis_antarctica.AAC.1